MEVLRIYLDTSVIGGCCDAKFAADSRRVIDLALSSRLAVLLGDVVLTELVPAPPAVRAVLDELMVVTPEIVATNVEVVTLRDAYLAANVVGPRWIDDAAHVAAATVAKADALISWNFKHIVRLDRIRAFNQVNAARGYGHLIILSPSELREYESRDDSGL